jgi:hypothetical protein
MTFREALNTTELKDFDLSIDDVAKIVDALEKQIPKKPKNIGKHKGIGACCMCGCGVEKHENYCLRCGQRLDWSDNNAEIH